MFETWEHGNMSRGPEIKKPKMFFALTWRVATFYYPLPIVYSLVVRMQLTRYPYTLLLPPLNSDLPRRKTTFGNFLWYPTFNAEQPLTLHVIITHEIFGHSIITSLVTILYQAPYPVVVMSHHQKDWLFSYTDSPLIVLLTTRYWPQLLIHIHSNSDLSNRAIIHVQTDIRHSTSL